MFNFFRLPSAGPVGSDYKMLLDSKSEWELRLKFNDNLIQLTMFVPNEGNLYNLQIILYNKYLVLTKVLKQTIVACLDCSFRS